VTAVGVPLTAPAGAGPATAPGAPERARVRNLDVLRAVAALGVLAIHAYAMGGRVVPVKATDAADVALSVLATGVWLFFAVSGYVITRPFAAALAQGHPLPDLGRYARRRALRIFPLYWLALTAMIAIGGAAGTRAWQFPVHYLLLNNLVPGRQEALFPAAWTLTLEVLFYAVVPLLARGLRAWRPAISAQSLARLLAASWALSIMFTVGADLLGDGRIGLWLRGSLPAMWQMFCPGILLAIVPYLPDSAWRRRLRRLSVRPGRCATVALAVLAPAAILAADAPLRFGVPAYQILVDLSRPLFAVGYGLIVAAAITGPRWRGRRLIALGTASYGIYLLHPVISALLDRLGAVPFTGTGPGAFAGNLAVLAALTIPLSLASWRWLERPALAWSSSPRSGSTRMPAVGPDEMRRFWNERAREDAFYFVDSRQPYKAADPERFWEAEALVDYLLGGLGVQLGRDDRVVEIGCGVGRITRVLAARAAEVLALDVSDEMLARARRHNPELANVRWMLGDGRSLAPLQDASVDACVSVVVLQHVPDPEITLGYVRELGRVLRPGGWAALQVSDDPSIHRPRQPASQRVRAALGRAPRGQRHPAWLGTRADLDAIAAAAHESATEVERVWGAGSQYCQVLLRRTGQPG
jgi:peptidoglycan/LPS O-acetylase OafA/YrhL/SAM-dependent methyltransferase